MFEQFKRSNGSWSGKSWVRAKAPAAQPHLPKLLALCTLHALSPVLSYNLCVSLWQSAGVKYGNLRLYTTVTCGLKSRNSRTLWLSPITEFGSFIIKFELGELESFLEVSPNSR